MSENLENNYPKKENFSVTSYVSPYNRHTSETPSHLYATQQKQHVKIGEDVKKHTIRHSEIVNGKQPELVELYQGKTSNNITGSHGKKNTKLQASKREGHLGGKYRTHKRKTNKKQRKYSHKKRKSYSRYIPK